jgi:hypothetical protein
MPWLEVSNIPDKQFAELQHWHSDRPLEDFSGGDDDREQRTDRWRFKNTQRVALFMKKYADSLKLNTRVNGREVVQSSVVDRAEPNYVDISSEKKHSKPTKKDKGVSGKKQKNSVKDRAAESYGTNRKQPSFSFFFPSSYSFFLW